MKVLIAGGGIGALATAFSLHAVGIEAETFKQAREIGEVCVGINMLPHSAKELAALGLLPVLDRVGIRTYELIYGIAKTQHSHWGTRFWRWCVRCSARSRQRKALSTLDDRLLDDIGVSRQQANAESARPFWE